jgi:N-(5'phosphoribosyl)anthranilate (PRA) isomerase
MRLKYCSITGADDEVDIQDLSAIAKEYPFVEWAILLWPEHAGGPRCPATGWIEKFKTEYKGSHTALHLCGRALLEFIAGKKEVLDLMSGFKRIQLNLKLGDMEGKYEPSRLARRVKASPRWEFILPYGHDKRDLLPLFEDIPNHALLFDESAGRGISLDAPSAPIRGHFCGYAGGINPDNVKKTLDMIATVAAGEETWIDMESGVRTDDRFDLKKVRRVLEGAKNFWNPD